MNKSYNFSSELIYFKESYLNVSVKTILSGWMKTKIEILSSNSTIGRRDPNLFSQKCSSLHRPSSLKKRLVLLVTIRMEFQIPGQ